MKLKRIVEQQESSSQYYDLGRDFFSFTHAMDSATETVKNQFEQAIGSKLKGKKIRARASRGYKQFEKDYEIDAANVSIDDYYDNYVVVVKATNGKEYFLKPGFKVQILGAMEPEKQIPQQQIQPPNVPPQQPHSQPQRYQPSSIPAEPAQIKEDTTHSKAMTVYSIEEIISDITQWLPKFLMSPGLDLKQYIPRTGIVKKNGNSQHISYGLTIPVSESPGITANQINAEMKNLSEKESNSTGIKTIYKLSKFDARSDKYVIIINKITTY